jgi:hypothetical protein
MDSAVAGTPIDGGLWVVGGLWGGGVQRYDPPSDTWWVGPAQPMPAVLEPVDGCYGLDAAGNEVIILFPNATGNLVGQLQVYDVTNNVWTYWPVPAGFPPTGQWAHDIVSTTQFDIPQYTNMCFISGGANVAFPGGGNISTLWMYSPVTNTIAPIGNYTHIPGGFNWHASWYVPWVGTWGSICVGGGVDFALNLWADTQCYDLAAGAFLPPNVPLGPLPLAMGGMADGWKFDAGQLQIWAMNGLDPALNYHQQSFFADVTTPGFVLGPPMATPAYRTEGDRWSEHLYAEGGSFGLFTPIPDNQFLIQQAGTSHVAAMKMKWKAASRPGRYLVLGLALIHDQNHNRLWGGTVSADWTYPDGTIASQTQTIRTNGVVRFRLRSTQVGNHSLCVTGITIPGYPYDPTQNHPPVNPPCMTIMVGP